MPFQTCLCDPGPGGAHAVAWVQNVFGDCLYRTVEKTSFAFGLLSICCWLGAQVPQVVKNARTGTAESLSPFFLAQWLAGDTCNLLGCLLSASVLPTQTATAIYYLFMDAVMISQASFFALRAKRRKKALQALLPSDTEAFDEEEEHREALEAALMDEGGRGHAVAAAGGGFMLGGAAWSLAGSEAGSAALTGAVRHLLRTGNELPVCGSGTVSPTQAAFATALAWLSAACYLGSRIAQLRKNFAAAERRGDAPGAGAEGLSTAMFLTAVLANTLYGTSVLMRAASAAKPGKALQAAAPWMAGSLGCCALDVVITTQARGAARRAALTQHGSAGGMGAEGGAYEPLAESAH